MPIEYDCIRGNKVLGTVTPVPRHIAQILPKLPLKNVKYKENNCIDAEIDFDQMSAFKKVMFENRHILKNKLS